MENRLHSVQQAFVDLDAPQFVHCTSGMILKAISLLRKNPMPTRGEIIKGMEDNLSRCGAHVRIIQAVEMAAGKLEGEKK